MPGLTGVDKTLSFTSKRKISQGVDKHLRSAKKYEYKPGKMVADYLPQISSDQKSNSSFFKAASNNSSFMGPDVNEFCINENKITLDRLVFDKKDNQP